MHAFFALGWDKDLLHFCKKGVWLADGLAFCNRFGCIDHATFFKQLIFIFIIAQVVFIIHVVAALAAKVETAIKNDEKNKETDAND